MVKKIGALWLKKKENNQKFLAGEIEIVAGIKTKIAILKNKRKKNEKQPDYHIIVLSESEKKRKEEGIKVSETENFFE